MTNAELDTKVIELDTERELEEPRPPAFSEKPSRCASPSCMPTICAMSPHGDVALMGRHTLAVRRYAGAYDLARKVAAPPLPNAINPRLQRCWPAPKPSQRRKPRQVGSPNRRNSRSMGHRSLVPQHAGRGDRLTDGKYARRPRDYMTKVTTVAPDHNCTTPTWDAFLDRVTAGNAELVAFLKRMAGYALTGSTKEHALFFLHGIGANGKTTLINAMTGVAAITNQRTIETFTASQNEHHPTDLAGLRGPAL